MVPHGRINRLISLVILLLSLAFADGVPVRAEAPAIGQLAPRLVATDINGKVFDLARLRGQVIIVNFWATWCGPCRAEMPALDRFYRAFRGRGLALIGISVDRWADRDKVKAVMNAFAYPAAMSNEATVDDFPRPEAIPITYVIDRAGVLRRVMRPDRVAITAETLAATILPLLEEKTAPDPSGLSASR